MRKKPRTITFQNTKDAYGRYCQYVMSNNRIIGNIAKVPNEPRFICCDWTIKFGDQGWVTEVKTIAEARKWAFQSGFGA